MSNNLIIFYNIKDFLSEWINKIMNMLIRGEIDDR